MTGYASIATAVEAIKLGADDYLPKPATVPMILRALGEEDDGPADDGEMEVPDAMTPISRLQWEHIQQAMHETGGNVSPPPARHAPAFAAAQAGQAAQSGTRPEQVRR